MGEGTQGGSEEGQTHPHPPTHPFTHAPPSHTTARTRQHTHTHAHTHSHTPSLPLLFRAHRGSECLLSFCGTAPWHGAGTLSPSFSPSPATSQSPKGSGPAPCVPCQPPGFGFFFFFFMTQLAGLNPPITGDSSRPGKVVRGEGKVNSSTGGLSASTQHLLFRGNWFLERKVD